MQGKEAIVRMDDMLAEAGHTIIASEQDGVIWRRCQTEGCICAVGLLPGFVLGGHGWRFGRCPIPASGDIAVIMAESPAWIETFPQGGSIYMVGRT